jgi:hypothetical protein
MANSPCSLVPIRIAAARGVSVEEVGALIARETTGRQWGLFGDPRVNVLETNLKLDRELPKNAPAGRGAASAAAAAR